MSWRDKKLSFLETFIHKNSVSHDFYQWAKAEIKNEAIVFLYHPFLEKHIDYTLKPLNYFSDIFLIKNNYSRYYYIALAYKNINFYTNNTEDIEAIYKHIITDFEGNEKEYLLASLIGTYAMQNNIDMKDKIKLAVDESYKQIKNPDYLYYFEHAKDYYFILNKEFPDKVLSNTF